mmetsp:Transcript_17410/g.52191  ORF Transcript_17410/g.52191 Transcript_17410/m.52191 type:complete len:428 (+) Transcript_17410:254-1537(+)
MMRWLFAVVVAVLSATSTYAYDAKGFIKVCRGRFADSNGKSWYFAGWNGYTTMVDDAFNHLYNGKPDLVDQRFRQARSAGLTAVRLWAHGDGGLTTLQTGPGQYDARVFRSLDYVIYKARQYNVRVLMSVTTYWQDADGILAFARWAGLTYPKISNTPYFQEQWAAKDKFWTNARAKQLYKNHLRTMYNRVNSFNNIQYKNDWAIFAWGLFNEPRCPASQNGVGCTGRITNWGNEMFGYARSLSRKQLLTFGEEGFFAKGTQYQNCNPYGVPGNVKAGWAKTVGQDFKSQNARGDFAEFHLWPVNWQTMAPQFAAKWIQCHVSVCKQLGKPCVLGEFGRALGRNEGKRGAIAGIRNPYYGVVYKTVRNKVSNYENFGGDMFWQWGSDGVPPGQNGVVTGDSTFKNLIVPHGRWMKNRSGGNICTASG